MGEDSSDKPRLRAIPGQRVGPEDVNDTPEELEALAIRLAQDIETIDAGYNPIKKVDAQIMALRNGMDIVQEVAETEGATETADMVDSSIRAYVESIESTAPAAQYSASAEDMAQALLALREAIFSSHQLELRQKFPSPAWDIDTVREALYEGLAHASAILNTLYPLQPGEDPRDHKKRLETFLEDVAVQLRRKAENPPL